MNNLYEKIMEAVNFIKNKTDFTPDIGIMLGTGLGNFAESVEKVIEIPYKEIPYFPVSTVISHKGTLVFAKLYGLNIIIFEGRFHRYEGYSMQEIAFPIRVLRFLGAKYLILTNAVGGLNPSYKPGDIVIIKDHINLMGDNPLIGPNDEKIGPRFPDMSNAYDKELRKIAKEVALENKLYIHEGVFAAMTGPNLETAAEYRFLRTIGADTIGMSTVPEVITAVHCGLKTIGISVVTDACFPDTLQPVNVEKIIAVANSAEPKLAMLIKGIVKKIAEYEKK